MDRPADDRAMWDGANKVRIFNLENEENMIKNYKAVGKSW